MVREKLLNRNKSTKLQLNKKMYGKATNTVQINIKVNNKNLFRIKGKRKFWKIRLESSQGTWPAQ